MSGFKIEIHVQLRQVKEKSPNNNVRYCYFIATMEYPIVPRVGDTLDFGEAYSSNVLQVVLYPTGVATLEGAIVDSIVYLQTIVHESEEYDSIMAQLLEQGFRKGTNRE